MRFAANRKAGARIQATEEDSNANDPQPDLLTAESPFEPMESLTEAEAVEAFGYVGAMAIAKAGVRFRKEGGVQNLDAIEGNYQERVRNFTPPVKTLLYVF